MPFEKGHKKTGGKEKGSQHKTTLEAKMLFTKIMAGQIEDIEDALDELKTKPKDYLDSIAKLMPYFMPKQTDITSGGESINKPIIIDFTGKDNTTNSKTD